MMNVVRYAANRFVDVFVIGPAAIAVVACFVAWTFGQSPIRFMADQMAEMGEAFRMAPTGYVYVVQLPERPSASDDPHTPLPASEIASLPRKLVPVSAWTNDLSESLGRWYMAGVSAGLLFIMLLRGWTFTAGLSKANGDALD